MYVCVCNAVTENHIRCAVEAGHDTLPQLRRHLGVGGCCGRCNSCAREFVATLTAASDCAATTGAEACR